MESEKFNNLCSHYKDTFDNHKSTIKQRDRLFYILLLILSVFTLQLTEGNISATVIEQYAEINSGIEISNSIEFISTLLWFLLLGFTIRYFQIVIEIERQYEYLHSLEKLLNDFYAGTKAFTREGKAYLSGYPLFSKWVGWLYTIIFPALILISISIKIFPKKFSWIFSEINFSIDFLSFIIIFVATILYIHKLHEKALKRYWLWIKHRFSKK